MTIKLVRNEEEANLAIRELMNKGCLADNIYALAYSKERTDTIADAADINRVGMTEQGVVTTVANLFRSRGDELIAKMKSLGLSDPEAEHYEKMLAEGDILVITWPSEIERDELEPEGRDVLDDRPVVNPLLFADSTMDRLR
jgi:hypothetical protein